MTPPPDDHSAAVHTGGHADEPELPSASDLAPVSVVIVVIVLALAFYFCQVEIVKNVAEVLVATVGLIYFILRFMHGFFVPNLGLSIRCDRASVPDATEDLLVVIANLERGERYSLRLHDAKVMVEFPGLENKPIWKSLIGFERLSFGRNNAIVWPGEEHKEIRPRPSQKAPWLNLAPGDKTQFARDFRVPRDSVCTVEVAILCGYVFFGRKFSQWRASAVSLPPKRSANEP